VTQQTDELAKLYSDVAKYADAALRRLAEAQPGYPSGHDGTGSGSTQPERYEATLGDDAVRDLRKLREAQKQALHAGRDLWGVVTKWGVARDARSLAVADPEDEMWCRSCLTIRHFSTRRASGGVNCDWCATTLREINQARTSQGRRPLTEIPRPLLTLHAQGKRINMRVLEAAAGVPMTGTRTKGRKAKHITHMASTVTCGACLLELPVPDGADSKTVLREHHAGGCAA
jgi:hypothetical protein